MAHALEVIRGYPFASHVERAFGVRLATSGTRADPAAAPYFFEGSLEQPRLVADMLLALSRVARSRFHLPAAARDVDPIVTAHSDVLRFEVLSSCCGVYARLDLRGDFVRSAWRRSGTTNVDFNPELRSALGAISADEQVQLSIGTNELALQRGDTTVREKKVALPSRWLRGLCEVQAHQRELSPELELTGSQAMRFLQKLGAKQPRRPGRLTIAQGELALSYASDQRGALIGGAERLKLLAPVMSPAQRVHVWSSESGVCAWEVVSGCARLWFVMSPESARGFSGEGQLLETLARRDWRSAVIRVEADLRWQSSIDSHATGDRIGIHPSRVEAALGALATRGLSGYDSRDGTYFHRELPFDPSAVDELQPRLLGARRLLAHGIEPLSEVEAMVAGSGTKHRVLLDPAGDRCTCQWFAKHRNARGPCKHILAVQIWSSERNTPSG